MAEESEAGRGASGIPRVGKRKWGYDVSQVDGFLARAHALYEGSGVQLTQRDIQDVSFDLSKGGYDIAQVDAALSRLERAVTDKGTAWEIAQNGRVTWKATTMSMFRRIAGHAARPAKARFADGDAKTPSYDRRQVDRLIDQIIAKSAAGLGVDDSHGDAAEIARRLVDLNASSVSNVVFTQRRGKHGYDERQVDYYLNACMELLSRLESYARLTDYAGDLAGQAEEREDRLDEPVPEAPIDVTPRPRSAPASVFPAAPPAGTETEVLAPVGGVETGNAPASQTSDFSGAASSFDQVRQAERGVFAPAPSPPSSTYSQPRTSSPTTPVVPMRPIGVSGSSPLSESSSPEPSAASARRTEADVRGDAAEGRGDSSLAALAHLAESTSAPVHPDVPSMDIPLPDLKVPSVLWASSREQDSATSDDGAGQGSSDRSVSDESFSIPDLSFPVFDEDAPAAPQSSDDAARGDARGGGGASRTTGERN
ncbi:DivIVA domain-containing protein [uncultured Bifidobacterium sp.]|uniref:DivIVA domain-containing protein n=1 Tax=uncultured Bifidobacterium sp. TaxID=165187 RepID=UPI0028DB9432|nr:DivIVA domain-containing protein [uncultured Bifidobacterium sp.]